MTSTAYESTTRAMRKLLLPFLLCSAAACGDSGPEEAPPEVLQARREAARAACIGGELLGRAEENVATLEGSVAGTGTEDPMAALTRTAQAAALGFSQVYLQHAELRAAAAAQADSAANYSRTEADSLRHVQTGRQYAIRPPEAGSVEANAIQSYQQDFARIYDDPDHPCNWNFPAEQESTR